MGHNHLHCQAAFLRTVYAGIQCHASSACMSLIANTDSGATDLKPLAVCSQSHCQTLMVLSVEEVTSKEPAGCMAREQTTPLCAATVSTSVSSTRSQ